MGRNSWLCLTHLWSPIISVAFATVRFEILRRHLVAKLFQGNSHLMFNHLMGRRHRQGFVDDLYKNRVWPFRDVDLSRSQLLEIARANSENDSNLGERIKTRISDEVLLRGRHYIFLKDKLSGISSVASRKGPVDLGTGWNWLHSRWRTGELWQGSIWSHFWARREGRQEGKDRLTSP